MALTDESPHTRLVRTSPATPKHRSGWRRHGIALALFVLLSLGGVYVGLVNPARSGGAPPDNPQTEGAREVPGAGSSAASQPAESNEPAKPAAASLPGGATASLPGGATALRAGVPVGYARTQDGAQSAAVNYAVAYGSADMFVPARRHAIVATIVERARRQNLTKELDQAFTTVGKGYQLDESGQPPDGLTFVSRTAPIGVRLVAFGGGTATVEVWTAGIVGLAGEGSPTPVTEAWTTATIQLHWSEKDWKWVSFTQRDGPVPASGLQTASTAADVVAGVRDFAGLRYAR
jgi:hypothetical protein